jgi:hypothetical protein
MIDSSRMSRKERLLCIFNGGVPDRPAVKVWRASPLAECPRKAFEPVRRLAVEKTDLVVDCHSPFDLYCGVHWERFIDEYDEPSNSKDWINRVKIYHTPEGELRSVYSKSAWGKPGYDKEHLLKDPGDIKKLLSIPYAAVPINSTLYKEQSRDLGDAGIVQFHLDHAMYGLERLIGSENFALWSFDYEDLMLEAIEIFSGRICDHAKAALTDGINGAFGWVGPELCIPPLMSPAAFDKYVYAFDKKLIEIIHNDGGRAWVHCHGKMKPVIARFADMGVDALNPIEPPPMGDVSIEEAFEIVGDRMALEGNIESHDMMTGSKEDLEKLIHQTLEAGRGKRLILCPSSGYAENPNPTSQEIENWLFYINEAVRYADEMAND